MPSAYYIATDGSDDNPGTIGAPFLTIEHAQTVVQAAIAGGMSEIVRVYLRGGAYTISTGLSFGADDSGRDGFKVIWASYPGENAIISGGEIITGWTAHEGGIYKASITPGRDFRQIYVNGVHAQRARGEDNPTGWARTETGYTVPEAMASWGNQSAIEIVSRGSWAIQRCPVSGIVGTALTMAADAWALQEELKAGWVIPDTPTWVENAYELMASGYWYLDKTTSTLYYWPPGGTMDGLTVVAPKVETLLDIDGASSLEFQNIALQHSNYTAPNGALGYAGNNNYRMLTYDEGTNTGTAELPTAAVHIANSSDVAFISDDFVQLGSALAIRLFDGNDGVEILNSYFDENAGGEIQVGNGANEGDCVTPSKNVTVKNCYCGPNSHFDYESAAGIAFSGADGNLIEHNEIVRGDRGWSTIVLNSYPYGSLNDTQVTKNKITYAAPLLYADGGALYMAGAQSTVPSLAKGTRITGNSFDIGGAHICMYSDFLTSYVTGTGNVCKGVSWYWLDIFSANCHDQSWTGNYFDSTSSRINEEATDIVSTPNSAMTVAFLVPSWHPAYLTQGTAGISWGVRPGAQPNAYPQRYTDGVGASLAASSPWPTLGHLSDTTTADLTVVAPNGGEQWTRGSWYLLSWRLAAAVSVGVFDLYVVDSKGLGTWHTTVNPVAAVPGQLEYSTAWSPIVDAGDGYRFFVYHRPSAATFGGWDMSASGASTFSVVAP